MIKYRSGLFFWIGFLLFGVFMSGSVLACTATANMTVGTRMQPMSLYKGLTLEKREVRMNNGVTVLTSRVTPVCLSATPETSKNESVSDSRNTGQENFGIETEGGWNIFSYNFVRSKKEKGPLDEVER